MVEYLITKIKHAETNWLISESMFLGLKIFVKDANQLPKETNVKLWIHVHYYDQHLTCYGFLSSTEKELFRQLITIKGLGCKTAMQILQNVDFQHLIQAIAQQDKAFLMSIKTIGIKWTNLLIMNLHHKYQATQDYERHYEITQALKKLGFDASLIKLAMETHDLDHHQSLENQINQLLKIITKHD